MKSNGSFKWINAYNKNYHIEKIQKVNGVTKMASVVEEKFYFTNVAKILVRNILLKYSFAEEPTVFENDENLPIDKKSLLAIKGITEKVLAYGKTFVFAYIDEKGNNQIDVFDKFTFERKGDELSWVKVNVGDFKGDKSFLKIYDIEKNNDVYNYKIEQTDKFGRVVESSFSSKMLPFEVFSYNNYEPIYANAWGDISKVHDLLIEIYQDMDISRKKIGIPSNRVNNVSANQRDENHKDKNVFNTMNRGITIFPYNRDEEAKYGLFQKWDGEFNPNHLIKAVDFYLNIITLSVGIGANFLAFDEKKGGIKTAKEVASEENDLFNTKKNIDKYLIFDVIKFFHFIKKAFDNEPFDNNDIEAFEVHFSDNIFTDDESQKEEGIRLFANGVISRRVLLKKYMNYTQEEINEVLAEVEAEVQTNEF